MKKSTILLLCAAALLAVTCGCAQRSQNSGSASQNDKTDKTLVVYFSHQVPFELDGVSGASFTPAGEGYASSTQYLAEHISRQTGADIFRLTLKDGHYPDTYEPLAEAAKKEHDEHILPELTSAIENIDDYSTIIIGYPIWWYDMPMAVYAFFDKYDLAGKRIAVFTTHLGSELCGTLEIVSRLEPQATVVEEGFSANGNEVAAHLSEADAWLRRIGCI